MFVLSVDSILGREALVVLSNLIQLMAEKIDEPILHVNFWIKGRIAISVVRSYSRIIHGLQLPIPLWYWDPNWDLALGNRSAQYIACQNNFMRTSANFFLSPMWPNPPTLIFTPRLCSLWPWMDTNNSERGKKSIGVKSRDFGNKAGIRQKSERNQKAKIDRHRI